MGSNWRVWGWKRPSSVGRICVCSMFKDECEHWLCNREFTNEKTNVLLFLKVTACSALMRQILIECIKLTFQLPEWLCMVERRSDLWLKLVQNGSPCQAQAFTNSCFSLWNLVVEVALKGWFASTSCYSWSLESGQVPFLHFQMCFQLLLVAFMGCMMTIEWLLARPSHS